MNIPEFNEIIEPNDQTEAREKNLKELTEFVGNPYPNKFERSNITGGEDTITKLVNFQPIVEVVEEIGEVVAKLAERTRPAPEIKEPLNEKLKSLGNVRIAGRLATPPRVMGKAAFVHLSDGKNRLQIYVRKQDAKAINNDNGEVLDEDFSGFTLFGLLDHGDFVGVEGFLFLTNTGELSVHVETIQFLAKAMLPMPDKMHGIADPELRRRYRYMDLIGSSLQIDHEGLTTREIFERRAKIISSMRRYLEDHGYIEVETPMLTPKATGAAAEPFETFHKALDIPLFARIAPELYLKRLMVGGFEKVFELNRNFRNEGLSHKHNPEFTMLEFYCAYMDVNGMMDFCEEMLKKSVLEATGSLKIDYEGREIDFEKPFERISMKDAVHQHLSLEREVQRMIEVGNNPEDYITSYNDLIGGDYEKSWLDDPIKLRAITLFLEKERKFHGIPKDKDKREWKLSAETQEERKVRREKTIERTKKLWNECLPEAQKSDVNDRSFGANDLVNIFEEVVEEYLTRPTFIIDFPKSVSPLSKASPENPAIAERFELFINGMEVANGFSELNDPKEQYERFRDQMKERESGDAEAMVLDEDYIKALSYGMPPAAGIGIGIDRIVMLLTNQHSIRDVILFPHMRPEKNTFADEEE
jgi:lysyl-tRNA synthetase class 2